jgi:phosphoenolpyruvate-protein kinase (PTS system EI component)
MQKDILGIAASNGIAIAKAFRLESPELTIENTGTDQEVVRFEQALETSKSELEGIVVAEDIEVGMMVEITSSAVMADVFAKEVDFFSIGTNDLIQYTLAADRMNERVSYLYQPYNLAILRLVKMVIDAARKEGKWAGMCGEMAGDEIAIPILLGLGLDKESRFDKSRFTPF